MRGSFHRKTTTVSLCAMALAATVSLVVARAGGQDTGGLTLYRGDTLSEAGIKTVDLGSGSIGEDKQMHFSGTHSLRISTHGYYQGGALVFDKPVDLAPFLNNKHAYLQIVINVPDVTTNNAGGAGGSGGFPGYGRGGPGVPGGGGGLAGGGGFPGFGGGGQSGGGFPGYGGGGGAGQQRGATAQRQKARNIEQVRVALLMNNGKASEFLMPMEYARTTEQQWKQLSIPVNAIPGVKADAAQVREVRIFGNVPGVIYVGQIRVVTDVTPLTVDRIGEKVVNRNARNVYTVRASAGIVPLKITWDFDESDGIQEELEGRSVVHRYHKTGDYTASVTVRDIYGVIEPKTVKFKVLVTP